MSNETMERISKITYSKKKLLSPNLKIKIFIICSIAALAAIFFVASIIAFIIIAVAGIWVIGSTLYFAVCGKFNKKQAFLYRFKNNGKTFNHRS